MKLESSQFLLLNSPITIDFLISSKLYIWHSMKLNLLYVVSTCEVLRMTSITINFLNKCLVISFLLVTTKLGRLYGVYVTVKWDIFRENLHGV